MKVSVSLDGKQATDLGQSKWITNSEVKQDVYHLRHTHDAVLTGNGTINADNPLYTTRIPSGKNPIRIVLAKSGNVDFTKQLFKIRRVKCGFTLKIKRLKVQIET